MPDVADDFTVNAVDDDVKAKQENAVVVSLCILRKQPICDLDLKGHHCFFRVAIKTGSMMSMQSHAAVQSPARFVIISN